MSVGSAFRPSVIVRAGRPAATAREMLASCLGPLQDAKDQSLDVQDLTATVAKAMGELYAVQSSEPADPAHAAGVRRALDRLRGCLQILQDANVAEPAVHDSAATIAKVLAILYAISKGQERASMLPGPAETPKGVPHDVRRATRRIAIDADIGFQSDTNFYTGFSEDISEGGLFVSTYDFLPLGTKIAVNFTLPDGHLVGASGVVRWVREQNPATPETMPGMGVQFTELAAADRKAIERFLHHRAPLFYEGA